MEKIWLKHYPKNISSKIDSLKFNSIIDLMKNSSSLFPNHTAFTNLNTQLSYKKIDEYSEKFGAYLQNQLSITKSSKVAIMLLIFAALAAIETGKVDTASATLLTELSRIIMLSLMSLPGTM